VGSQSMARVYGAFSRPCFSRISSRPFPRNLIMPLRGLLRAPRPAGPGPVVLARPARTVLRGPGPWLRHRPGCVSMRSASSTALDRHRPLDLVCAPRIAPQPRLALQPPTHRPWCFWGRLGTPALRTLISVPAGIENMPDGAVPDLGRTCCSLDLDRAAHPWPAILLGEGLHQRGVWIEAGGPGDHGGVVIGRARTPTLLWLRAAGLAANARTIHNH